MDCGLACIHGRLNRRFDRIAVGFVVLVEDLLLAILRQAVAMNLRFLLFVSAG